ncbi:MAG: family 10 glycosylhydrolase [bacterium]
MKRIVLMVLLAGCFHEQLNAQAVELRGVWMTPRSGNNFWTKEQIARAMDSVAANNFNVVYFNAWSRGWPLWRSTYFFQEAGYYTDPAAGERDLLQEAITEAHRRGLELEAWMEYGFVGWYSGYPLPGFPKGPLFNKHPDWLARSSSGSDQFPIDQGTFFWMSHNHPAARMFLITLHQELAGKYDLDGIELDRIRYPNLDCGYDSVSIALYKQENNGSEPPANTADPQWMRWRADKLNSFHAQIYDSIKAINKYLIVSNAPSHYGSGSSYPAYQSFLQDWKEWLNAGKLDAAQVQMYADPGSLSAYIPSALNGLTSEAKTKVFAGVAIKPGGTAFSASQVVQLITTARNAGLKGVSIWYYNDLFDLNYFSPLKNQAFPLKATLPHRKESWRNEGLILDEIKATRTLGWKTLPFNSAWEGSVSYVEDSVAGQSIQYQFSIPGSAYYEVYAYQFPLLLTKMTDRAPYLLRTARGSERITLDQSNASTMGWIKLADAFLEQGNRTIVEVSK